VHEALSYSLKQLIKHQANLEDELDGSDIKKIVKSTQPSRAVRAAAPATPASRADVTPPDSLLQVRPLASSLLQVRPLAYSYQCMRP
jgi:hypothetical protein